MDGQPQQFCAICDEPLKPKGWLPTCQNCRSSMGMWENRRPAEILERRRKLKIYDTRIAELVDAPASKKRKR